MNSVSAASKPSLPEAFASVRLLTSSAPGCRRFVAVGYMDPGNWATDLASGSQFGYLLLSVVLLSNVMAMLLQHLALKLGIVTGLDLAQACRERYPRWVSRRSSTRPS